MFENTDVLIYHVIAFFAIISLYMYTFLLFLCKLHVHCIRQSNQLQALLESLFDEHYLQICMTAHASDPKAPLHYKLLVQCVYEQQHTHNVNHVHVQVTYM